MTKPPKQHYFIDEIANMLGVPIGTVRDWVLKRKIRSYRPGRRRLIYRDDFLRFMRASAAPRRVER